MWLRSSIDNGCCSGSFHGKQDQVFSSCDWWLSRSHSGSLEILRDETIIPSLMSKGCAHFFHVFDKRIQWTSSKLTSLRCRHHCFSHLDEQRSKIHHRSFHFITKLRINTSRIYSWPIDDNWLLTCSFIASSKFLEDLEHVFYVRRLWDIVKYNIFISEQCCWDEFDNTIFVWYWFYGSLEWLPTTDNKFLGHRIWNTVNSLSIVIQYPWCKDRENIQNIWILYRQTILSLYEA